MMLILALSTESFKLQAGSNNEAIIQIRAIPK